MCVIVVQCQYLWLLHIMLSSFSGKSNLMDAVSFVLGDTTTNMRANILGVSTF